MTNVVAVARALAKNTELRDQQLPYFTNVSSSMTDNYSASVVIGTSTPGDT